MICILFHQLVFSTNPMAVPCVFNCDVMSNCKTEGTLQCKFLHILTADFTDIQSSTVVSNQLPCELVF